MEDTCAHDLIQTLLLNASFFKTASTVAETLRKKKYFICFAKLSNCEDIIIIIYYYIPYMKLLPSEIV